MEVLLLLVSRTRAVVLCTIISRSMHLDENQDLMVVMIYREPEIDLERVAARHAYHRTSRWLHLPLPTQGEPPTLRTRPSLTMVQHWLP